MSCDTHEVKCGLNFHAVDSDSSACGVRDLQHVLHVYFFLRVSSLPKTADFYGDGWKFDGVMMRLLSKQ
jgi:hypothetical protein